MADPRAWTGAYGNLAFHGSQWFWREEYFDPVIPIKQIG